MLNTLQAVLRVNAGEEVVLFSLVLILYFVALLGVNRSSEICLCGDYGVVHAMHSSSLK